MKIWAEQSGLSFKLVRDRIPNIYIQYDFIDGPGGTVGIAYSPQPNGMNPSSDLKLDSGQNWVINSRRGRYCPK